MSVHISCGHAFGLCVCGPCKEGYLSGLPATYENMRNMTEQERLRFYALMYGISKEQQEGRNALIEEQAKIFGQYVRVVLENRPKSLWQRIKGWFK